MSPSHPSRWSEGLSPGRIDDLDYLAKDSSSGPRGAGGAVETATATIAEQPDARDTYNREPCPAL